MPFHSKEAEDVFRAISRVVREAGNDQRWANERQRGFGRCRSGPPTSTSGLLGRRRSCLIYTMKHMAMKIF